MPQPFPYPNPKNKSIAHHIFVTFLDVSQAFDRIDHWLLFKKLIDKHVPLFIIRLLVCWYSTQKMHIRWGNTVTSLLLVSNGVKQSGIISPILFNVYMDGPAK